MPEPDFLEHSGGVTSAMHDASEALRRLCLDPIYIANREWGVPRWGHPEGSLGAHIEELEANLKRARPWLLEGDEARLRLIIHAHDICKPEARKGVSLEHPLHHGRLARQLLARYSQDSQALAIVEHHDDGYYLFFQDDPSPGIERLLVAVEEVELFLLFTFIDGCLAGKLPQPVQWFAEQLARHRQLGQRVMECFSFLSQSRLGPEDR